MSRWRRIRPWLASFLFLISLLVLLEVALRVLAERPGSTRYYVSDPAVGFRMRPHMEVRGETTNSRGFNDRERPEAKEDGVSRVAILGDSFVFGVVAREHNFTTVLSELLEKSGGRVEVLNMGIPAAGPESYLGVLTHDAVEMQADAAVVVFFVGNDVWQSHPDFVTRVWLGSPRALLSSPYLVKPSVDYVYVGKLLRASWRFLRSRVDGEHTLFEVERHRLRLCLPDPGTDMADAYEGAVALMKTMRDESRRQGTALFVVLAPDRFQVDEGFRGKLLERYGLDPEAYSWDRPQANLGEALEELGIATLDLLPAFAESGRRAPLYRDGDTHWNEAGNRLAGEELFLFFRDTVSRSTPLVREP